MIVQERPCCLKQNRSRVALFRQRQVGYIKIVASAITLVGTGWKGVKNADVQ